MELALNLETYRKMVITHPWWFCQVGGETLPVPPGKPAVEGERGSCQPLERNR